MITTKELRLKAFTNTAKNIMTGKGLGLSLDNFIVLLENIQFKYAYTDTELQPIWDIINPPLSEEPQA